MKTILIVDDEAVLAETVAIFLKLEGYRVLWASDGRQALKIIEDEKPDLILADLVMPNMDGLQLLEWLRDRRSLDGVKVIMMTVKESLIDPLKRHSVEANGYLPKPFDKDTLIETINRVLCAVENK